ncbi:hypothetical protein JK231_21945 [Pantoea sp. JGM49]|uniref:helix-turn-helix transcriptional regulator n=1 Tax=unclassified Pantoea TaxID=2630326 RepID=UPI001BA7E6CA|nr:MULTISPECIES: LuxR C-terminal-related transcriptional regulator [unclassified Pantoea]MBS0883259.1 hypothetical protein [Pantoea sp. JGM49]
MKILNVEANLWAALGLEKLLISAGYQFLSCSSLSDAKKILIDQSIEVMIIELKTEADDIESSYAFLRLLQALYPCIRVLVLTDINDAALLNFLAHEFHSVLFLTKKSSLASIVQNVNTLAEKRPHTSTRSRVPSLSLQEFHMLKWLARYSSQQDIALRVRLNNKTISHYKRSIYAKLNCENNVQFHHRLTQYGFNRTHVD